jgi:hypothetical protein
LVEIAQFLRNWFISTVLWVGVMLAGQLMPLSYMISLEYPTPVDINLIGFLTSGNKIQV